MEPGPEIRNAEAATTMRRAIGIAAEVGRDAIWVTGVISVAVLTALAGEAALTLLFG